MKGFSMAKSRNSNIPVTIRFPEELYQQIKEAVNKANEGNDIKAYSFNGFVTSACGYALQNMDQE